MRLTISGPSTVIIAIVLLILTTETASVHAWTIQYKSPGRETNANGSTTDPSNESWTNTTDNQTDLFPFLLTPWLSGTVPAVRQVYPCEGPLVCLQRSHYDTGNSSGDLESPLRYCSLIVSGAYRLRYLISWMRCQRMSWGYVLRHPTHFACPRRF